MNPWDFFETSLYINLDSRSDRLIQFHKEMERVGVFDSTVEFKRIPGIPNNGTIHDGFNQAQHNAIEACNGNSVVFEDDCIFGDTTHLRMALDELPQDWDLLYLGGNVVGSDLCNWEPPQYYSPHLKTVKQAWTTHAIAYSQKGRDWILKDWDFTNGQMYDDYLRCNLGKLQAFIICPMIADQRKGYSDIWKRDVDYGFFNKWEQ